MKLLVFLGGPFHNHIEWRKAFVDIIEMRDTKDKNSMFPLIHTYRYAFGDYYIGIYYWRLEELEARKIREQAQQLRNRYDY